MALDDQDLTNPGVRKNVIRQLVHNLIAIA